MSKPKKPVKKVAIVGFSSSRDEAPFDDPSFEIWGLNDLFGYIPRYDKWFELHDRKAYKLDGSEVVSEGQNANRGAIGDYMTRLKETVKCPIYMTETHSDIPNSVRYPIEDITREFGNYWQSDNAIYGTNSISFMIALAIYEKYDEIHVFGVDMAVDTEYNEQRPSCEFFLGVAYGRGIKLYLPATSDLLKTRFIYGFEGVKAEAWALKCNDTVNRMSQRKNDAENIGREQEATANKYIGAIQASHEHLEAFKKAVAEECNPTTVKAWMEGVSKSIVSMNERLEKCNAIVMQNRDTSNQYKGAVQAVREMSRTWFYN